MLFGRSSHPVCTFTDIASVFSTAEGMLQALQSQVQPDRYTEIYAKAMEDLNTARDIRRGQLKDKDVPRVIKDFVNDSAAIIAEVQKKQEKVFDADLLARIKEAILFPDQAPQWIQNIEREKVYVMEVGKKTFEKKIFISKETKVDKVIEQMEKYKKLSAELESTKQLEKPAESVELTYEDLHAHLNTYRDLIAAYEAVENKTKEDDSEQPGAIPPKTARRATTFSTSAAGKLPPPLPPGYQQRRQTALSSSASPAPSARRAAPPIPPNRPAQPPLLKKTSVEDRKLHGGVMTDLNKRLKTEK